MTPTSRFSLQTEPDREQLRSRLLADAMPTHLRVPGTRLLHQFSSSERHLLITDFDNPREETTSVILLDGRLRAISWRSIGALFSFLPGAANGFRVRSLQWRGHDRFILHGHDDAGSVAFAIRRRPIPYVLPGLAMRRMDGPGTGR